MRSKFAHCTRSLAAIAIACLATHSDARGHDTQNADAAYEALAIERLGQDEPPGDQLSAAIVDPDLSLAQYAAADPYFSLDDDCASDGPWRWEILPAGLIYRSYLAGPREPRFQINFMQEASSNQTLWDVTLGGRQGILRYGTSNPIRPEGWELDIEGAAFARLNIDNKHDVDTSDYRFGIPLTYGLGRWQYKVGYYHVSSHLGDELIARTPGAQRKNYVRDSMIVGVSFNPRPEWRLYGETAYAPTPSGGAQNCELQFGVEYVQPGLTGVRGTPFFATNGHLRQEHDFGGDYTLQLGWLWRGYTGSTLRTGFQFLTGHSNQYQFYDESEEQYGWAIWYDN